MRGADRPTGPLWRAAQILGLLATAALLAGLVWAPELSLRILWKVVIPLVPASLLISPMLWRNTCPLATLNMLASGPGRRRGRGVRFTVTTTALGIGLLAALVPARRFLFNTDGLALALTILTVAALAVALGTAFEAKAGFCSALCPVLPVERLYGQSPLLRVGNPRCTSCTGCVRACLDVSPAHSIRQVLGRARHTSRWLTTPFGIFAAAFPGFVLAYFTLADGPLSAAGSVYLRVLLLSGVSYLVTGLVVTGLRLPASRVLPTLGAAAAGIYYWYAAPDLSLAVGAAPFGPLLRALALALVLIWWWQASLPLQRHASVEKQTSR